MTHEERVQLGKHFAHKRWNNPPFEVRFWNKVDVCDPESCWEWKGAKGENGYGKLKHDGKHVTAHRMALRLTLGKIAPGLNALHKCNNPLCCNPSHLYQGTHSDNLRDAWKSGSYKNRRKRRYFGYNRVKPYPKTNPNITKLTDEMVIQIRERISQGESQPQVARFFQVNQSTISRIVHHLRRKSS